MKKIAKIAYVFVKVNFSLIYCIVGLILIAAVVYFLGYQLVEGAMQGTDTAFAQANVMYLDKWFPRIPLWYPYQGAGQSITLGYYVLTYYIPIFIHHLSSLTLVQAMKLTEVFSVIIVAWEIYFYCWLRLKNQTVGLLAGIMYPLSSATWAWMIYGGFYAMSISLIFLLPAFLFYDWFLELILTKSTSVLKKRIVLLFAAIFLALALSSHLAIGASVLVGMGIYTLFRSQLLPLTVSRKKSTFIAVGILLLIIIISVLVSAALFFPQRHYNGEISQDIIPVYGDGIPQLDFWAFLGVKRYSPFFDSIYQPMFLSVVVSLLAGLGLIMGLLKRHFMGGLGLTVLIMLYITTITGWINHSSYFFSVLMLPTNVRLASFVFIVAPILAAYGAYSLVDVPFWILRHLLKIKNMFFKDAMHIVIACGAILLFLFVLYSFRFYQQWPAGRYNEFAYNGFGPMDVVSPFCLINPKDWPPPVVLHLTCKQMMPTFKISNSGRDYLAATDYDKIVQKLHFDRFTRTDVSVHLGYVTATANMHSEASMINSYNGIGALIYIWAGHEIRTMFLKGPWIAQNVSEMAKYFGIKYVFLHAGDDKDIMDRYPTPDWTDIKPDPGGAMVVKAYTKAPEQATQFTHATILVIGNLKKGVYENTFEMAYMGGLSIDQGLLVKGKENIDDYSLSELERFDTLILQGYAYHNRDSAMSLLRQYISDGGSVFIDTGWQYVAKDWGVDKSGGDTNPVYTTTFPDFFPIRKTTWGDAGNTLDGFILQDKYSKYHLSEFAPLTWGSVPWGLAYASRDDLGDGAQAVLSKGDKVIIAEKQYGKGRIVWSGMSLINHVVQIDHTNDEHRFVKEIFNFLVPAQQQFGHTIHLASSYPDEIDFTFTKDMTTPTWVYFREAYTQDWRPQLILTDGSHPNVTLYKAGPGLTLMYLPPLTASSRLHLVYSLGLLIPFSVLLSICTLLCLLVYFFDGVLGKGKVIRYLQSLFTHPHVTRLRGKLKFKRPNMKSLIGEEDE